MPSATATGDHYLYREERTLALFTQRGLLRYKDAEAYYCSACTTVYNVVCPRCRLTAPRTHGSYSDPYAVFKRDSDAYERWDGFLWTRIQCLKCDYTFKVIVR